MVISLVIIDAAKGFCWWTFDALVLMRGVGMEIDRGWVGGSDGGPKGSSESSDSIEVGMVVVCRVVVDLVVAGMEVMMGGIVVAAVGVVLLVVVVVAVVTLVVGVLNISYTLCSNDDSHGYVLDTHEGVDEDSSNK